MTDDLLSACEETLGYRFKNRAFLKVALVHSSDRATNHLTDEDIETIARHSLSADNERLEFLGDAVLGFVTSDHLYRNCPEDPEGKLTHIKSIVVSRRTLAQVAQKMELERFVIVGKGMNRERALPRSILSNLFEALVAAVYLDGGIRSARRFVMKNLMAEVNAVQQREHVKNYKSLLQQYVQRTVGATPTYRVIEEHGPDHSKEFVVSAIVGDTEFPAGRGDSKKTAQQHAAELALEELMRQETEEEEELDLIDS